MATPRAILRLPATRVAAGSTRNLLRSTQIRYKSDSGQQASPPSVGGANDYQFGPANDVQPQPSTQSVSETSKNREKDGKNGGEKSRKKDNEKEKTDWKEEAKGTEESTTRGGHRG